MSKLPDNDNEEAFQAGIAVDELITAYRTEKERLDAAVEGSNIEEIRASDRKLVALFEALLAASPRDQREATELTSLLLDELCPRREESIPKSRIKLKIQELMGR